MTPTPSRWLLTTLVLAAGPALATEYFVQSGSSGTGTAIAPFGTIQQGINAAQPGDTVTVRAGTYPESLTSSRSGTTAARITIRAAPAATVIVSTPATTFAVSHEYLTVEGITFDANYAFVDGIIVNNAANHLVFRRVEVRRAAKDCIDIRNPIEVLIESSLIHHCLRVDALGARVDAHGIVAGAVQGLTIRNTEIHTFSGDAPQ